MESPSAVDRAAEAVLESIRMGRYPHGAKLPGERTLSEHVGFSRMTVRAALQQLADQGHLTVSSQRGWFVNRLVVGERPSTLQSFTEMAAERGLRAGSSVLTQEVRAATLAESAALGIAPTSPVVVIRRLRTLDGHPITVEDLLVPRARAPWLADEPMTDRSLYEALAAHGVHVDWSSYTVSAILADRDTAAALGLDVGAAVLLAEETAHTSDGSCVLKGTNHYRGDAYQFTAQLLRPSGA